MKKFVKIVGAGVVMCALLTALSGCERKQGPAEKAGKAVDSAVDKTGQQIEKAGDSIQDAAKGDKKP
ncbi:hypothetical protein [Halothiobacillus sp.]|uniref:hypothetical protein n=1 Tax=Halothiobacillus sp. TaxID=1891311 RepID=UPI00263010D3|nr:hypothetical protein [Halothiobacillus sp.]